MSGSTRVSGIVKLAAAAAAGAVLAGGATAIGSPEQPGNTSGEPTNLGTVKTQIEDYYGDYLDPNGKHHHSQTSRWATETNQRISGAKRFLNKRLLDGVQDPAIVLDIDDTSVTTYGWEADNDFGFDDAEQEDAINSGEYEAIEPTVELANWAAEHGVRVYFLTGRKQHQGPASLRNLAAHGYPKPTESYFKPETHAPEYLPCGLDCDTIQYKSGTRAHIESTGSRIVLNIGDQLSDLEGGHAEKAVKLPNPMYFLP